jgi:hypothetical protein
MDPLGRLPLALVDVRLISLDEPLPATAETVTRLASPPFARSRAGSW